METGGISDDEISLTSTVESEQQSEYDVETILAEEEFPDGMRFLVRWLGYSLDRCTWEPAGSFNFGETLQDWELKKQLISEGKESAFDVAAWEARLVRLQEERDERKRRRSIKRRKLSASEANSTPAKHTAPTIRRANSDKGLGGSTAPRSLFQDGVHPARQGLLGSSAQRLPPVLFGPSQSTPDSARPKKPSCTDKPKLFKNLSTKWRYEKLGRTEPAPDKNQLDLRRPTDWAPISPTDITQLGPSRLVTDIADESRIAHASDDPLDSPRSSHRYQRSPVTSSIPNNNAWNVTNPEPIETRSEPINNMAAESAKPASEFNLEFPPRRPSSTSKFLHPKRWWNRGELYVTIYLGPEKLEIGDVRLCGIPFEEARGIFKMKVGKVIELWFKDLCTLDEYNALCHGVSPNKSEIII
jgi:chromo domain-containing protein 1